MTTRRAGPTPDRENREPWVARLWRAVESADEAAAEDVATAALEEGVEPESVLLDIVGAVQRRVGAEWAANRMSVAQEHAATAIADRVVAALARATADQRPPVAFGRITVACVDGEWHALPARLLSEVLRLRGWQVDYLGAQVPTPYLIEHLQRTGPDAVALSGSLATRLPAAHTTLLACHTAGVPVLVGGAAFGADGRYARLLGADAWAPDARTAADRLAGRPLPPPVPGHQASDDLPHLADQEYTYVSGSAAQLVKEVLVALEERLPDRHTAEEVADTVSFLSTALYIDDDELFTDFVLWTTEVLTARDVASEHLLPVLDVLSSRLQAFPRATRLLDRARQVLNPEYA